MTDLLKNGENAILNISCTMQWGKYEWVTLTLSFLSWSIGWRRGISKFRPTPQIWGWVPSRRSCNPPAVEEARRRKPKLFRSLWLCCHLLPQGLPSTRRFSAIAWTSWDSFFKKTAPENSPWAASECSPTSRKKTSGCKFRKCSGLGYTSCGQEKVWLLVEYDIDWRYINKQ